MATPKVFGGFPMDLSIVVPCYNEAGNLPGLIARFREQIARRPRVEVVLVNNGSTDDSAAVFAEIGRAHV